MMIVGCKLAQEAVQKLTHNLLRVSKQAMYVFKDKDLWLLVRLTRFMYGCHLAPLQQALPYE